MKSKASCLVLVEKLDNELDLMYRMIAKKPVEALCHQPAEDQWSVLQICKHLQLSENLSLKNLQYNMGRIASRPTISFKNAVSSKMLGLALQSPLKFKSPVPTRYDHSPDTLILSDVFKEWSFTRRELKKSIEECAEDAFSKQIYKHPYAGYLTIGQMMIFFRDHFTHHHKQILQRLRDWQIAHPEK